MDRPVWTDQCDDCGRRYPSAAKLRKHTTRMHGERVHCQFQGCNWNCSSQDVYRLRTHELESHSRRRFIPMATPRTHQSMPSVVHIPSLHSITSTPLKTPPPTPNWKLNENTACSDGTGPGNARLCRYVQLRGAIHTIPNERAER